MKKLKKILIWLVSIILVVLIAGAAYLHFSAYQPNSSANQAVKIAQQDNKEKVFKAKDSKLTVVFYPGALVSPNSYSIWAKRVAAAGYTVKIAHFPLNMALFKTKAADQLIDSNEKYVIGSHSLGGAMAASYANPSKNKNLQGVLNWKKYREGKNICQRIQLMNQLPVEITAILVLMVTKKVIKKLRLVMLSNKKLLPMI